MSKRRLVLIADVGWLVPAAVQVIWIRLDGSEDASSQTWSVHIDIDDGSYEVADKLSHATAVAVRDELAAQVNFYLAPAEEEDDSDDYWL